MVENHCVVSYTEAFEAEFHIGPGDVMLQYSVCSFDIYVEELFGSLLDGAAVRVPPAKVREDFCKHGIGRMIVDRLIEEARKNECDKIYLETTSQGKSLYLSMGFSEMTGMMIYGKDI